MEKNNYYYLKLKDKKSGLEEESFKGIILDIESPNRLHSHRYYYLFMNNDDKNKLYRIKSIAQFLTLLSEQDYDYTIELLDRTILKEISYKNNDITNNRELEFIMSKTSDKLDKIYNYLISSNEVCTLEEVLYNNEKKITDGRIK